MGKTKALRLEDEDGPVDVFQSERLCNLHVCSIVTLAYFQSER